MGTAPVAANSPRVAIVDVRPGRRACWCSSEHHSHPRVQTGRDDPVDLRASSPAWSARSSSCPASRCSQTCRRIPPPGEAPASAQHASCASVASTAGAAVAQQLQPQLVGRTANRSAVGLPGPVVATAGAQHPSPRQACHPSRAAMPAMTQAGQRVGPRPAERRDEQQPNQEHRVEVDAHERLGGIGNDGLGATAGPLRGRAQERNGSRS